MGWTLLARTVQFLIMFLSVKIMTTLLPPSEVGKISLITTTTAFFALILLNPVGMFMNLRLHTWVKSGSMKPHFHHFLLYLLGVTSLSIFCILIAVSSNWVSFDLSASWLIVLIGGSLLCGTVNQVMVPSLNMVGRTKPFAALTIATLLMGLMGSIALTSAFDSTAQWWLLGGIWSQFVFAGIAYRVFFAAITDQNKTQTISKKIRSLWNFCWPVALAVSMNWAHMQGYRWILAEELGLTALGLFAAGYGVAMSFMAALESVMSTWFQPVFYREANDNDPTIRDQAWNRYAVVMLPASIWGLFGILVAAPYLTRLMLGPAYHGAVHFVMLGAIAEWTRFLVGVFGLHSHMRLQTKRLIVPNFLGMICAYTMMWWLLPTMGLDAAPWSVAAGGLLVVGQLYLTSGKMKEVMRIRWSVIWKTLIACSLAATPWFWMNAWLHDLAGSDDIYWGLSLIGLTWAALAWRGLQKFRLYISP